MLYPHFINGTWGKGKETLPETHSYRKIVLDSHICLTCPSMIRTSCTTMLWWCDKAADINHGQPSALARGIDANGSKVGRAVPLSTSHIYNAPTFEP